MYCVPQGITLNSYYTFYGAHTDGGFFVMLFRRFNRFKRNTRRFIVQFNGSNWIALGRLMKFRPFVCFVFKFLHTIERIAPESLSLCVAYPILYRVSSVCCYFSVELILIYESNSNDSGKLWYYNDVHITQTHTHNVDEMIKW